MRYDLYECNTRDTHRYILGKSGSRMLFVVGLNPSTANRLKPDTTVAKVERVAELNGFDGFVMTNLSPVRATDPTTLPKRIMAATLTRNVEQILAYSGRQRKSVFWAAWGSDIVTRAYLLRACAMLQTGVAAQGGRWVHFGALTKMGHPRHPSRLAYAWSFAEFDVGQYLGSHGA